MKIGISLENWGVVVKPPIGMAQADEKEQLTLRNRSLKVETGGVIKEFVPSPIHHRGEFSDLEKFS